MKWTYIESLEDLQMAISKSNQSRILLFKHSTRCPVSSMAKKKVEMEWEFDEDILRPYFLDLIKYRNVSNEIARMTGVEHESPQAIVMYQNEVVYHGSHGNIHLNF